MKKIDLKELIRETIKEDFGLVLPDGTINGDPKGKEKTTIKKYKQKEKNITEGANDFSFNNINFLIRLWMHSTTGYIQVIPKTTKDLDALNQYGKQKMSKFLKAKFKQLLSIPVQEEWDGSAGLKFGFFVSDIEDLLLKKLTK